MKSGGKTTQRREGGKIKGCSVGTLGGRRDGREDECDRWRLYIRRLVIMLLRRDSSSSPTEEATEETRTVSQTAGSVQVLTCSAALSESARFIELNLKSDNDRYNNDNIKR